MPVLKDAGEIEGSFGQLVVAAASIADFGAIVLLSLFFSREATGTGTKLLLLGSLALLAAAIGFVVVGAERSRRLSALFVRLQDTTAQIRVRGAFVLLVGFAAIARSNESVGVTFRRLGRQRRDALRLQGAATWPPTTSPVLSSSSS